jgi:hypothetical protein
MNAVLCKARPLIYHASAVALGLLLCKVWFVIRFMA